MALASCLSNRRTSCCNNMYLKISFFSRNYPTVVIFCLFSITFLITFYHSTRMHSADYAVARCLCVCPSICLSVHQTTVFCLNGYTISSKFFSPSRSTAILVFVRTKQDGNILTGNALTGASNARGMEKS